MNELPPEHLQERYNGWKPDNKIQFNADRFF